MKTSPKDKRTKDQLLKLLDDALVQEERRAEELDALRTEVEDLRKRAEDPRAELVEDAIPSSKVPFRLDFYQSANGGTLKGIIEHLPSRQKRTFAGDGQVMIAEFVAQFLPQEIQQPVPENEANSPASAPLQSSSRTGQLVAVSASDRTAPAPLAERPDDNARLANRLHEEFLLQFPELQERTN